MVVYILFSIALIVCGGLVFGLCFVLQYFLVMQSSRWGIWSWLLYFCFVLIVMSVILFFESSSRCNVLVCSI